MARFLDDLLDGLHARPPLRAGPLIVSVFGDAVAPRGGSLALASLLEIMRGFRVTDGLVRTALSRLVADDWFSRWKVGRNSYYRLTSRGRATFAEATAKIYGDPDRSWAGTFDLVLVPSGTERGEVRGRFLADGYGALGPDLLIAPQPLYPRQDGLLRFTARLDNGVSPAEVAARAWPLSELAARYERFVSVFAPASPAKRSHADLSDYEALLLRILLVHEYRRVILRDPLLPADLLPHPWIGDDARALCRAIYCSVAPLGERWLDAHATTDTGPLPASDAHVAGRFTSIP